MPPIGFIQSDLDLKLLVLYITARTAGPVTFMQLLEVALCDAGVDYFSLTQAVEHMVETGQLTREDDRYAITENGRRNSQICESSLPYSVRMHCDENLRKVNDLLRQEAQIQSRIRDNEDGTHTLFLHLDDVGTPLLQLELLVADRAQAERMGKAFKADPTGVYHDISTLLAKRAAEEDK